MEECPLCNLSFNCKKELDSHLQKSHKKFVCEICHALLSSLNYLTKHKNVHHLHDSHHQTQVENKQENKFSCEICPSSFHKKWILDRHNKNRHQNIDLPQLPKITTPQELSNESNDEDIKDILHYLDTPELLYSISKPLTEINSKRLGVTKHNIQIHLTNQALKLVQCGLAVELIIELFSNLIKDYIDKYTFIQISIDSLALDYPISIPFWKLSEFNPTVLADAVQKVLTSNANFVINEKLDIFFTLIEPIKVAGPTG